MDGAILELDGVSKVYRRGAEMIAALDALDLRVSQGSFLALMGPSGSGKTTLLNLVAGIDRPTTGHVRVGGVDISQLSAHALAKWRCRTVGFIFQFYNLIPVLTALENVELPLMLTPLSKKERRDHALAALELVGLADRKGHYSRQLSGGEEQRVAIARAIVADPIVIAADEPTGDLDAANADHILTLIEKLNREFRKTVLMVTHDPRAARRAQTRRRLEKGVLMTAPDPV